MEEVLSIAQFAEAVGVSKQAIYKQVKNENSKLYPFIIFDGKTPMIKVEAVEALYHTNQPNSTQEVEKEAEESQPIKPKISTLSQPKRLKKLKPLINPIQPKISTKF